MDSAGICMYCKRNRNVMISFLFFLTFVSPVAAGRSQAKLIDSSQVGMKEEKLVSVRAHTIGSAPPKCERRCGSCGHCEAVQVPVTTEAPGQRTHFSEAIASVAYSRGDAISNYKPMCWKCKCGNLLFSP
ncbi:hypothetical protein K2173_007954 [Erythroxylum novogranatense]|uniref:Epidermal patterning factor-like protein n=1 Tax=Erythroxylum novogranatense TaxID=1862640 RepID=A0AAV8T8B9_9ROSI|nr:hypothetical protein K2173_007954 [Erythroxylum novogranatense]